MAYHDGKKKLEITPMTVGYLVELNDPGGLTYLTTYPIDRMGWKLTFDGDLIHAHIADGSYYERREVYQKIKNDNYYKHTRIYYYQGRLYTCIKSELIGPGR